MGTIRAGSPRRCRPNMSVWPCTPTRSTWRAEDTTTRTTRPWRTPTDDIRNFSRQYGVGLLYVLQEFKREKLAQQYWTIKLSIAFIPDIQFTNSSGQAIVSLDLYCYNDSE